MFKSLLAFTGPTASAAPAAPPARPLSRRSDKAVGPRPTVREPEVSREEIVARYAARDARNAAVLAEQQEGAMDGRFANAVRLICMAHDRTTLRYIEARDVAAAENFIGKATSEYLRACRYAGVRLPLIGDAMPAARLAALRANILARTMSDLDTWERGELGIAKAQAEAKRHGEPVPALLEMPADVAAGLLRIAQQRIERLARRSGGKAGSGTETASASTTDSSAPRTDSEATTDETETYTPPGLK